jgi:excisionase family DNA binding protein
MQKKRSATTQGTMVTVDQAWDTLGGRKVITRQALYLAVARGELPSVRLGRRILIPRLAFEQWMTGQTHQTSAA